MTTEIRVTGAVREYLRDNPPELRVQIIPISRSNFLRCRKSRNHIAGQAQRQGVTMAPERLEGSGHSLERTDSYPDSWPDVRSRIRAAERNLRAMQYLAEATPDDQENYGFHGQQAVENSLKAWASAADIEYRNVHDLQQLADLILADPIQTSDPEAFPAIGELHELLAHTTYPDPETPGGTLNWLSRYAVIYRYEGAEYRFNPADLGDFIRRITQACEAFVGRAQGLTSTGPADLGN